MERNRLFQKLSAARSHYRGPVPTILIASALIACLALPVAAGITGKISGFVTDAGTGEPIVGATVRVEGTSLATLTDMDGEYFLINVPSGKYSLVVSSVGFETVTQVEVRVLVDLTTPVDFKLPEHTVELGEKLVVYAEDQVIQKDLTGSRIIFTSDRLLTLPNITTVQSVLTNYPGVVIDRDNALHIRGGRSGQVAYYYDGYSIQDPFANSSGLRIMPTALSELTLTSGGYSAEYGEALSGIVSAVTREGGSTFHGGFRAYEGYTHTYDLTDADWGDIQAIGNRGTSFYLSGPITPLGVEAYTFSLAGEYVHNPTSLPHNGFQSYTGTAKITATPAPRIKLSTNVSYYQTNGEVFRHRDVNNRSYSFNLDGLPIFEQESILLGFSGNYSLSDRMVLTARINRFETESKSAPSHLFDLYWNQWPGYSEDSAGNYNGTIHLNNYGNNIDYNDPMQIVGFTAGSDFEPSYRYRKTVYNAFQFSAINQVNSNHEFRTGLEIRRYHAMWDFKQFYNSNPYGEKYSHYPLYISVFAQDKMEFDDFILNAGLRYDYRNTDAAYITYTNGLEGLTQESHKARAKGRISPRFGISFPISEITVMHANYGVYYQMPQYTTLYTNLDGNISSGRPLLGNPDLAPEQTSAYELGIDHLFNESVKLDVTVYYKDVQDLVTSRSIFEIAGNPVTQYVNEDYGSVKGIDVSIEKLANQGYLSGSISYSYMVARGNGSYSLEPYYTYLTSSTDSLAPLTEYPLDFDQRHTATAVIDFRVPAGWDYRLFGVKMPSDWGLNVVGHYGSGLPYTRIDRNGNRLGDRNEARLPAQYTVDMRFNKNFRLKKGDWALGLFVEVDNLFNRLNVTDVYAQTGRPDADGQSQTASAAQDFQTELDYYDRLYDHDPANFTQPRTLRAGLELHF